MIKRYPEVEREARRIGAAFAFDRQEKYGPLVGIATGLAHVSSEYAIVLGCDMPFVDSKVVSYLFDQARGYDAAVPIWPNGYIEPLHAVYRVELASKVAIESIGSRRYRLRSLIEKLSTNFVEVESLRKLDPALLTLSNVNSAEDLEIARQILLSGNLARNRLLGVGRTRLG